MQFFSGIFKIFTIAHVETPITHFIKKKKVSSGGGTYFRARKMYTKDWNENSEMICTVRLLNLTDCTFNVSCTNHVLLIWSYFDLFFLFLYKNAGILFLLLFYYSSIVHFFSLHVQCQLHLSVLWWWSERKPKADAQRRLECTGMGGGGADVIRWTAWWILFWFYYYF